MNLIYPSKYHYWPRRSFFRSPVSFRKRKLAVSNSEQDVLNTRTQSAQKRVIWSTSRFPVELVLAPIHKP